MLIHQRSIDTLAPLQQISCHSVARVLARVLPGSADVAWLWSDHVSASQQGGYSNDPHLLEEARQLLDTRIPAASNAHTWSSSDGQTQFVVVWRTASPCAAAWLTSWCALAMTLIEATLESIHLQDHVQALERLQGVQQALYEIAALASNETNLTRLLERLHQLVGTLMHADSFFVADYEPMANELRFLYYVDAHDPNPPQLMRRYSLSRDCNDTLIATVIRNPLPMNGSSSQLQTRPMFTQSAEREVYSADWLAVPMLRDGHVAGAIVAQSYDEHYRFSDQEMTLLTFVAQHVLTAIDRRLAKLQLESRVSSRTQELEKANHALKEKITAHERAERLQRALFKISELANSSDDIVRFCAKVHEVLDVLLDARNFYIALVDNAQGHLDIIYHVDENKPNPLIATENDGLANYLIQKRVPLLLSRNAIKTLEETNQIQLSHSQAESWLGVPMFSDDEILGAIVVQSYVAGMSYTLHDQQLMAFAAHNIGAGLARQRAQKRLQSMYAELEMRVDERTRELAEVNARLRSQIAERLRAEERLTHQALHDALTGLPNRTHLLDKLHEAIITAQDQTLSDENRLFAVLFLDLDRFKLVNDSVGHAAGDRLLIEAAKRIVSSVREGDLVARLGGDEFAVLLRRLDGLKLVLEIVNRLLETLGQPLWIAGRELFPSGSVGVALWNPSYRNGEEIIRDADAAMYRAKSQRQSRFAVFDDAMRQEAMRLLDLETDLRRALKQRDFSPFYQPIVRLEDDCIVGYEALLRWKHPTHGYLQPDALLQLEQASELIEQVDWQIYEQVVQILAQQPDDVYISINVSPQHFHSGDFSARLLGLLDTAGADPTRLRIEITEMALLDDEPKTLDVLKALRERGMLIQLDDFGTGYSALSYLHRFPISILKIDQSFVADLQRNGEGSYALVRSIIALAATLGLETIAEGVQTQHQRLILENLGCRYGQGYLLGIPSPYLDQRHR